jgi:hypothetical protein
MYAKEPQDEQNFLAQRRDAMFDYQQYCESLADGIETFEIVGSSLANKAKIASMPADRPMVASEQRAWDSVRYLHLQYSAGVSLDHLRDFYPLALDYWEEYAVYHERFHATPEAGGRKVPHLDLYDKDYWDAVRLCCFAILLGHTDKLPRLCAIWDYENDDMDGLLERLVAPFVPGRAAPPDECTRHLPYFKTLKIFAAAPEKRPALMARYLDEWYVASRREPYYESHTEGRDHNYLGYWSFEAAAITVILDIDDSGYRDLQFYPKDLVDYARRLPTEAASPVARMEGRLRGLPNEVVPKTGQWWSPAFTGNEANRFFQQGERFPETETTPYGAVVWYFDPDKQEGS